MTQHELLTAIDNWQPYENPNAFGYTAELLRLAAVEIRRLQTSVSTVQRDGEYVNAAIGTAEAGL
jgi:hypothetical protein